MSCNGTVLALTPVLAKLSMHPESSDGFASVGAILPREEAALLPGGFFVAGGWVDGIGKLMGGGESVDR